MKVDIEAKTKVPIKDVPSSGGTFIYDDDIFMRVNFDSEKIPDLKDFPDKFTGVNLSTGEITTFEDDTQVIVKEYKAVPV